jgi:hypothetical protein
MLDWLEATLSSERPRRRIRDRLADDADSVLRARRLRVGVQRASSRVAIWDLSRAYAQGLGSQTNRSVIAHQDHGTAAELRELLADPEHFLVSVSRLFARSGHKIHLDSRVRPKLGGASWIAEPARQLRKQAPDAIGALRTPLVVFESVELFNDEAESRAELGASQ